MWQYECGVNCEAMVSGCKTYLLSEFRAGARDVNGRIKQGLVVGLVFLATL